METIFDVVWASNSGIGRSLVISIVLLAIYAVRCAISHTTRYRAFETANLASVERTLKEAHGRLAKDAKPGTPMIISIEGLRKSASPESIIGDRLSVLQQLRAAQVKVSMAALQEVSLAVENARRTLRFPSFAVGLLMLMGLLGTFIGIAIIVQNIAITDTTSLDAVRVQINGALTGMRTKFSTTLVGLFCAIIVSLLNFRLAHEQAAFFQRLDRFTGIQLLPATVPAVEDETLLEKLTFQLETSFSHINDIGQQNVEMLADAKAIQTGFGQIISTLQQNKRGESPERIQGLISELSTVLEHVVSMNETIKGVLSSLPSSIAEMSASVKALSQMIPQLVRDREARIAVTHSAAGTGWNRQSKIIMGVALLGCILAVLVAIYR